MAQDALTGNLNYSTSRVLRAAAAQQWVRDMARSVASKATTMCTEETFYRASLPRLDVWACSPSQMAHMPHPSLPVEGIVQAIGLKSGLGYIVIPEQFEAAGLERFDRWETYTALRYEMWVDFSRVTRIEIQDIVYEGELV